MKIKSLPLIAFLQALGVTTYIALLTQILPIMSRVLPTDSESSIGPMIFLLFFVISAAVTGGLVLGYAVALFLENRKRDAVILFIETIGYLIGIAAVISLVVWVM